MKQRSSSNAERKASAKSGLWEFARGSVLIPTTVSSAVVGVVTIWETSCWLVVPAMRPLLLMRLKRVGSGPIPGRLKDLEKTGSSGNRRKGD